MGILGEIRLYDLVLFVHIAAVVVAFGPTFAYPFFQTVSSGSRHGASRQCFKPCTRPAATS
jgi:hypothetical protein